MSWHGLIGTPLTYGGSTGTVTIGNSECLLFLSAYATVGGASVKILGGPNIPVVANANIFWAFWDHTLLRGTSQNNQIVFTNCTSYFLHTVKQGST